MKLLLSCCFFALSFVCSLQPCLAKEGGTLSIAIKGFRNDKGFVRLELFDEEVAFDKMDHVHKLGLRSESALIKKGESRIQISNLPYGRYALRFFHDEDGSETFYTNFLGIPKVEYGFSNNARGHLGPAKFKAAVFSFLKDNETLDLSVARAL